MSDLHNDAQTPWQIALPVLRRLSATLDASTRALARHDLKELEKHVAAQEELCALLLATGYFTVSAGPTHGPAGRKVVPSAPPAQVRQIARRIDQQTRVYAALLHRARRVVEVVLAFHESSRGYSPKGRVPLEASSTWSSEV